jgi:hypothetical protein
VYVQQLKAMVTKNVYHLNSTENDKFPKTVTLTNFKQDIQAHEEISEEC